MSSSGVSAYAYVNTRVRGMAGKLLKKDILGKLIASPNLDSMISTLKETDYGQYLEGVRTAVISSRRASYEIRRKISAAYGVILKNTPEFAQRVLNQFLKLYEVDNLKAVLRGIEIQESWEKIRYMLFPLDNQLGLPFEEMIRTKSIDRALVLIQNTAYYQVLTLALDRYHNEKTLFPLEVALDLNYWQVLWNYVNELPRPEKEITKKLIGLIVDKNNLTWAARYRIYHHLSESEIINYTLPFGCRINDKVIRAIASGRETSQLVAEVYPALAPVISQEGKVLKKLPLIELELKRLLWRTCHTTFMNNSFNIGLLLAYLILLEFEIQDITLLLEAKSLGISASVYSSYLINEIPIASRN